MPATAEPTPISTSSAVPTNSASSLRTSADVIDGPLGPPQPLPRVAPLDDSGAGRIEGVSRRATGPGVPVRRGSVGGAAVEHPVDDGAGVPCGAPVVVEELGRRDVGAVAAGPGHSGQLDTGPRQLVA